MTVQELIALLQDQDQDRIVVMSKDGEGNCYSPFDGVSTCSYRAETTWYGEIGLEELTEENIEDGYDEDDVVDGEKALCLWPVN
jgi:hypothetical protein